MASFSSHLSLLLLLTLTLTLTVTLTLKLATAEEEGRSTTTAASSKKRKTYIFRVDRRSKPSIFPTHAHWYASPAFAGGGDPLPLLHVYDTVFHGFSASLHPDRAAEIARHPAVLAFFEDRLRHLHTTRSPQFLGLRTQVGLWSDSDYGSDVIVGVLDTGVWPERRSFSDRNLGPVPSRWRGACESGPDFPASLCNRKLVGARSFSKGHDSIAAVGGTGINGTMEFRSPRDAEGHGTHTVSTADGRHAFCASMASYATGVAKGVSLKARIAAYKGLLEGLSSSAHLRLPDYLPPSRGPPPPHPCPSSSLLSPTVSSTNLLYFFPSSGVSIWWKAWSARTRKVR